MIPTPSSLSASKILIGTARQIAWGWFTAVVPIASRLRGLARRRLEDEWRVSELAESTVHEVWYRHLDNFGLWPSARIWRHAKWKAEDLRAGGWRARRGVDAPLPEDDAALASLVQLADPRALARLVPQRDWDFADEVERREFFAALVRRMKLRGDVQAGEMLDMLCHGMDRAEINAHFSKETKYSDSEPAPGYQAGPERLRIRITME